MHLLAILACAALTLSMWTPSTIAVELTDRNIHLRGALTNSHIQFEKHKAGHVAFMGGSITEGNVTAVAEANIFNDPEARDVARILVASKKSLEPAT